MVTRLKPQRVKSSNSPQVGQNLWYEDSNNFKWQDTWSGVWDMKYSDFEWETLTWNAITIEDISNNITPSSNFTVSAGTVKPGIEYVLRVNTGNTPYTMTLGTGVINPNSYKTELKPNTVNQFKFIATSTSQLELEGVDSAIVSEVNWGEIGGTLSNQTDLQDSLDDKQDLLIAWSHIQIASDWKTISAIDWIDVDVQNKTLYISEDWGWGGWWGGDVVWPSSAVNGHIAVFNWTTWKVIMDGWAIPTLTFANIAWNPTDNANLANALSGKQDVSNLVTSVSSSSTDSQYPSAKLFYDTCWDIETLINAL